MQRLDLVMAFWWECSAYNLPSHTLNSDDLKYHSLNMKIQVLLWLGEGGGMNSSGYAIFKG